MKVVCTGNDLSDIALTPIHRSWFETRFGPTTRPRWEVIPGRSYTVYGIRIIRGYPFYWLRRDNPVLPGWGHIDWGFIPSICFTVTDDRMSRLWRIETRIIGHSGNEVFDTTLYIPEFRADAFLTKLVDGQVDERALMKRFAAEMDAEFG